VTDGLTVSTASAHGIHFARCDYCQYGQCPGGGHRWANRLWHAEDRTFRTADRALAWLLAKAGVEPVDAIKS